MSEDKAESMSPSNSAVGENSASKPVSGPGSRLRTAREARNMAVSDVATQLRLDNNVITAMENDDYAVLPSATFVKGYLRSYGRMLALDVEVLVAEYQAASGVDEARLKVPEKPVADSSSFGKWFWVILALISILLLAWYWSKPNDQPVSTDTLVSDSSLMPSTEVDSDSEAIAGNQLVVEAEDSNVIEQLLSGLHDPVEPELAEPAPIVTEAMPESAKAKPAVVDTASASAAKPEPAAANVATLTLIGQRDSWVSIRDAQDNRVYRNMLKPGQRREVSGVAPLIVHLGYAPGVKIEVDGQAFEHKQWHKANSTARFVFPTP